MCAVTVLTTETICGPSDTQQDDLKPSPLNSTAHEAVPRAKVRLLTADILQYRLMVTAVASQEYQLPMGNKSRSASYRPFGLQYADYSVLVNRVGSC
jgi:hypothetical protein